MKKTNFIIAAMLIVLAFVVSAEGVEMTKEEIAEEFDIKTIYHPLAKKNFPVSRLSKETLIELLNNPISRQYTFSGKTSWVNQKLKELGLESGASEDKNLGAKSNPKMINLNEPRHEITSKELAEQSAERKSPDQLKHRKGGFGGEGAMTGSGPAPTTGMKTTSQAVRESGDFSFGRERRDVYDIYPQKSYFGASSKDAAIWKVITIVLALLITATLVYDYKKNR